MSERVRACFVGPLGLATDRGRARQPQLDGALDPTNLGSHSRSWSSLVSSMNIDADNSPGAGMSAL